MTCSVHFLLYLSALASVVSAFENVEMVQVQLTGHGKEAQTSVRDESESYGDYYFGSDEDFDARFLNPAGHHSGNSGYANDDSMSADAGITYIQLELPSESVFADGSSASHMFVFDVALAGPEEGAPVFFLHGAPQTWITFEAQITELATRGFRCIAPNQRGYSPGARPSYASAYVNRYLVGDILAMADKLGYDSFHVVGHGWGATISWLLGSYHPDRVRSLVAVSAAHPQAFEEKLKDQNSCQYRSDSAQIPGIIKPGSEAERPYKWIYANGYMAGSSSSYKNAVSPAEAWRVHFSNVTGFTGTPHTHISEYVRLLASPDGHKAVNDWYRANMDSVGRYPEPTGGYRLPFQPCSVPTLFVWPTLEVACCEDTARLSQKFVTGPYEFYAMKGVTHAVTEEAATELSRMVLNHVRKYPECTRFDDFCPDPTSRR